MPKIRSRYLDAPEGMPSTKPMDGSSSNAKIFPARPSNRYVVVRLAAGVMSLGCFVQVEEHGKVITRFLKLPSHNRSRPYLLPAVLRVSPSAHRWLSTRPCTLGHPQAFHLQGGTSHSASYHSRSQS